MEERTNVSVIAEEAGRSGPATSIARKSRVGGRPTPSRWCPTAVLVVGRHPRFIDPAVSDSEVFTQRQRRVPGIECVQALSSEETQTIGRL